MLADTPIVNQFFPLASVLSIETLVTASVTLAQNDWDGLSDEEKEIRGPRPTAITIP